MVVLIYALLVFGVDFLACCFDLIGLSIVLGLFDLRALGVLGWFCIWG